MFSAEFKFYIELNLCAAGSFYQFGTTIVSLYIVNNKQQLIVFGVKFMSHRYTTVFYTAKLS
jgi:hypothetical protein